MFLMPAFNDYFFWQGSDPERVFYQKNNEETYKNKIKYNFWKD